MGCAWHRTSVAKFSTERLRISRGRCSETRNWREISGIRRRTTFGALPEKPREHGLIIGISAAPCQQNGGDCRLSRSLQRDHLCNRQNDRVGGEKQGAVAASGRRLNPSEFLCRGCRDALGVDRSGRNRFMRSTRGSGWICCCATCRMRSASRHSAIFSGRCFGLPGDWRC